MILFLNIASLVMLTYVMYIKVIAYRKFHKTDSKETLLLRIIIMLFIGILILVDIALMIESKELISVGGFLLSCISLIVNVKP